MKRTIIALVLAAGAALAVSVPAQAAAATDPCSLLRANITALRTLADQQTSPQVKAQIELLADRQEAIARSVCGP